MARLRGEAIGNYDEDEESGKDEEATESESTGDEENSDDEA